MIETPGHELVAVTTRNGIDESYHYGSVVVLGRSGEVEFTVGNPDIEIYGRSSNKPMQAVAMVRAGLDVPSELLALVCASHSGTPHHLSGVRALLALGGFDPDSLANTKDYPLDDAAAHDVVRAGGPKTALQMNCSGKHAGMLLTCRHNRWACDASYLSPDHPLQRRVTDTIDELAGVDHTHIGVDGCGAPAHVLALSGLARAVRAIAIGGSAAERAVFEAMTTHPFNVGGPDRDVTGFMQAIPGLVAKDGAEGVYVAALPDGRAVALKVADGGDRARPSVLAAALAGLGVDVLPARPAWSVTINGHGQPVGIVRPSQPLAAWSGMAW